MKRFVPMTNGDEYDALTKWRKVFHWKEGRRAYIKRSYRRRERKVLKAETLWNIDEETLDFWGEDYRPDWIRRDL
jgi:hypothetical protein